MSINLSQLSKDSPIVKAAHLMVEAHARHDTMSPALYEVAERYPDINPEYLKAIWIGVNAKNQERG